VPSLGLKRGRVGVLLLLTFSSQACHGKAITMNHTKNGDQPADAVSHSEHLLSEHLALPATPLDVLFEQVPRGVPDGLGPTDYVLVALYLDKDVLAQLAKTSQLKPPYATGYFVIVEGTDYVIVSAQTS
jgi:hypothetical protein